MSDKVVCRTSSVKRHFETKHQEDFKDNADKTETIKKALSDYGKQRNTMVEFTTVKNYATEASYEIANCIAKHGKPFTDGEYIKKAFESTADVLFDGLPNKETIKSRIKEIPTSARTVQCRVEDMAENVNSQQTAGLKDATVFSVAMDESVDVNDMPRLAVMAKYCD